MNKVYELKFSTVREAEIPKLIEAISENLDERFYYGTRNFDIKYWYWQYKLNPKKQSYLYVAWLNNQIVGYYHVVVYNFIANGRNYVIGNIQDVAVSKKHQGKGIFKKLSKFANSEINKHVDALYSFPNRKSINTFLKYDNFELIDCMPVYVLPLKLKIPLFFFSKHKKEKIENNNKVVVFDNLNKEICEVFEKFSKFHKYHILKDKDFLNWRYVNSPKGRFFFVGLMTDNKISSVIVVKHEKVYGLESFVILDFAFVDNILDLKKLISNFYFVLNKNYSLNVNFVLLAGISHYISDVTKCGYIQIPKIFLPRKLNFLVRLTGKSLKIDNFKPSDWLVTLGDWDVF